MRLAIFAAAFALAAPVLAQNVDPRSNATWDYDNPKPSDPVTLEKVAANGDVSYYLRTSTIRNATWFNVRSRQAWFQYNHDGMDGRPAGTTITLEVFDCASRKVTIQAIIDFDRQGNVIDDNRYSTSSWQVAKEGTIRDSKLKRICR
jgi:hypothetical protein